MQGTQITMWERARENTRQRASARARCNVSTHEAHAVVGSLSWSLRPAPHAVQFVAPAPAYWPDVQISQAVLAFLSWSARPATQGVHCTDLVSLKLPAPHFAQAVAGLLSTSA